MDYPYAIYQYGLVNGKKYGILHIPFPGYTFVKATVDKKQNSNEITYLRMWYGEIYYYTSNGQTKSINDGSTIYFWYKPTAT